MRQDLRLDVARPERVLGLQRCDRLNRVRAAQRGGRSLAQAKVARLALAHQLRHRPDRLLDRRPRVDPVQVIEVHVVGPEPRKRSVDRAPHALGRAVEAVRPDTELRRQHDIFAPARDRPAHELLVRERPVELGRVEEVAAELDGARDRGQRLALVRRAVEAGYAHAAEPNRGNCQRPELARRHAPSVRRPDHALPVHDTLPEVTTLKM